jgi:hypothetical protein
MVGRSKIRFVIQCKVLAVLIYQGADTLLNRKKVVTKLVVISFAVAFLFSLALVQ